jgi:hypothetical protein
LISVGSKVQIFLGPLDRLSCFSPDNLIVERSAKHERARTRRDGVSELEVSFRRSIVLLASPDTAEKRYQDEVKTSVKNGMIIDEARPVLVDGD